jgi:polyisoprenoid-binding protein YceI
MFGLSSAACAQSIPDSKPARAAPEYRSVPYPGSKIRFESRVLFFTIKGHFEDFEVRAWIENEGLENTRSRSVLNVAKVKSDTRAISDETMRSQIDVEHYPESTVDLIGVSDDRAAGPHHYKVIVNATHLGKAYENIPIHLEIAMLGPDGSRRAKGSYKLDDGSVVHFDLLLRPVR